MKFKRSCKDILSFQFLAAKYDVSCGFLIDVLHQVEDVPLFLCMLSHSVMSTSLQPRGLQPTRLFCPWNFPGKAIGIGCHFFLQKIFPIQGSNVHLLHFLHGQVGSFATEPPGKPSSVSSLMNICTLNERWIFVNCLSTSTDIIMLFFFFRGFIIMPSWGIGNITIM